MFFYLEWLENFICCRIFGDSKYFKSIVNRYIVFLVSYNLKVEGVEFF